MDLPTLANALDEAGLVDEAKATMAAEHHCSPDSQPPSTGGPAAPIAGRLPGPRRSSRTARVFEEGPGAGPTAGLHRDLPAIAVREHLETDPVLLEVMYRTGRAPRRDMGRPRVLRQLEQYELPPSPEPCERAPVPPLDDGEDPFPADPTPPHGHTVGTNWTQLHTSGLM